MSSRYLCELTLTPENVAEMPQAGSVDRQSAGYKRGRRVAPLDAYKSDRGSRLPPVRKSGSRKINKDWMRNSKQGVGTRDQLGGKHDLIGAIYLI